MSKKFRKVIRKTIKDILNEQFPNPGDGTYSLGVCNTYNYNDGDAFMSSMFQNGCYGALTGTWMMIPSSDGFGEYISGVVEGYNAFCEGQPIGQGTPHDGGIQAQFMSMGDQWEDISCAMCQCLSQGWPEWPPDESNNDPNTADSCSNPEASQVWNTFSDDQQQVFCSECNMMPNENDEALADYLNIPNVCEVCCNSLPDPVATGCEADPSIYPTPPIAGCKGPCNEKQYSQVIDTNTDIGQFFEMWCSGMYQPEDLDQTAPNGCSTVENIMSYGVNMCEICSCFGPDADFDDDPAPEPDKDPVKDPVKDPYFNYNPVDQTKPVDPTSGIPGKAQKLRERFQKLANVKKGKGLIKD